MLTFSLLLVVNVDLLSSVGGSMSSGKLQILTSLLLVGQCLQENYRF